MKLIIAGAISALTLTAGLTAANAQTAPTSCFTGDTMDRGAGHTGKLGAPHCAENYDARFANANGAAASSDNVYGEYRGVNR